MGEVLLIVSREVWNRLIEAAIPIVRDSDDEIARALESFLRDAKQLQ